MTSQKDFPKWAVIPRHLLTLTFWAERIITNRNKKLFFRTPLSSLYLNLWNPINYALVGAVGVGINMLTWAFFLSVAPGLPWFFTNFIAIVTAWSWNWANSVGPFGYLWGFQHVAKNKNKRSSAKPK